MGRCGITIMSSETSGWYARLDHECPERTVQIGTWLESWLQATRLNLPIAAVLPNNWPTLPAGLLSNPGTVLDHLLARFEAKSDGRSPRGVYPIPAKFVDAILYDELQYGRNKNTEPPATLSLAALPPSFRALAEQFNEDIRGRLSSGEGSDDYSENRTLTGIPLPIADPYIGAGLFAERILRIHAEKFEGMSDREKKDDTLKLLEGLQLTGASELSVDCARKRILIVLTKLGIVSIEEDSNEDLISRSEAEMILESNVRCLDPLRGEWPWNEPPQLLVSRPPWLRIKDRFRGHPEGSKLRKDLSRELRLFRDPDGKPRFSAIKGNVNLYRLFIERSLQITQKEGRVRLVVPESVLREKSSTPLRRLLVLENDWDSVWSFPEDHQLFLGGSQGISVLGITVGGTTEVLTSFGPLGSRDLSRRRGLDKGAPFLELERGPWSVWTDTSWAVPKMPLDEGQRSRILSAIGQLSDKPRLVEGGTWLNPNGKQIRVRIGEVDSNISQRQVSDWKDDSKGFPLIRGAHVVENGNDVVLSHPALGPDVMNAGQQTSCLWNGGSEVVGGARLICRASVNSGAGRRLLWAVVPNGCVLANSVSFLDLPSEVKERLSNIHGTLEEGLRILASQLNSDDLDLWSKAWAANNNVNNYEIETLPITPFEFDSDFQ